MSQPTSIDPASAGEFPIGLKAMLASKSVNAVLFIDDAFEPLSNLEPRLDEAEEIWAGLEADGGALEQARQIDVNGSDDLSADRIHALLTATGPASGILAATSYVSDHASKRLILDFVLGYLGELGVDVRTSGRHDWKEKLPGASMVFLDWRLGPDGDANSVLEASNAARAIHGGPEKPLIVLISSDATVQSSAPKFSKASGLIEGLFDAMPKTWLKDRPSVDLQLAALLTLLNAGHVVQNFIDGVDQQASAAIQLFTQTLRSLSLSDYANLQHFALRKDGQPLGDYLAGLCSGLLADLMFRGELVQHLAALDGEDFASLPALTEPSDSLLTLHNSAVFDMHVGDFAGHPHSDPLHHEARRRYKISFGDVIVEEQEETATCAYIVMTPQCALAESPRQSRKIPDERTIWLLPGTLTGVDHPERSARRSSADTPAFVLDGHRFRIQWDPARVQTVTHGGFAAWLASGRQRRARMRPLYALALQNSMTQEMSKVGLPSPPPMYEPTNVVLCPAFGGKLEGSEKEYRQGRFVMARDSDKDQLVFTKSFVVAIKDVVIEGVERLRKSTAAKDRAALESIERATGDARCWAPLILPFTMPQNAKSVPFLGGAVLVCHVAGKPKPPLDRKVLAIVAIGSTEEADPRTSSTA